MPVSPIKADVKVGQQENLPPTAATWTLNAEEKYSSATILGAEARVFRHAKTGKFHGEASFPVERSEPVEGEDTGDGYLRVRVQLHDCDTLYAAQKMCELRIRDGLARSHPELLVKLDGVEHAAAVEAQGENPF